MTLYELSQENTNCQKLEELTQLANQLERHFGLSHIKPVSIPSKWAAYRSLYLAWLGERRVFIKRRLVRRARQPGVGKTQETEFRCLQRLYKINQKNFPESLFYSEDERYRCVGMEFIEGDLLTKKIESGDFSTSERETVIVQLKEITKTLIEAGIMHRDVGTHNLLVTKDGTLKLIDFEYAVFCEGYEDCPPLSSLLSARNLCVKCARGDMTKMLKTLKKIGCHESYRETYRDVEKFLKGCQGKPVVKCKHRRRFFLYYPLRLYEGTLTMLRNIRDRMMSFFN